MFTCSECTYGQVSIVRLATDPAVTVYTCGYCGRVRKERHSLVTIDMSEAKTLEEQQEEYYKSSTVKP